MMKSINKKKSKKKSQENQKHSYQSWRADKVEYCEREKKKAKGETEQQQ